MEKILPMLVTCLLLSAASMAHGTQQAPPASSEHSAPSMQQDSQDDLGPRIELGRRGYPRARGIPANAPSHHSANPTCTATGGGRLRRLHVLGREKHRARPLSGEMFQVDTCLAGIAVIAVLDQVLDLDCAKSSDVGEGLDLRIPKIVGAFPGGIGFSRFGVSSRLGQLFGANLARTSLAVRRSTASALPSGVRSFGRAGGFTRRAKA
jgi:hypothetical protein